MQTFHYAANVKSLFNGRVFYSEDGTNTKAKEMAAYMFFVVQGTPSAAQLIVSLLEVS